MVDLSPWLIDIEHQLWVDSCTAHAGTSALELLLNKERGIRVELDRYFLFHEISKHPGHLTENIAPILKEIGCPPIGKFDEVLYFIGSIFKSWQRKPSDRQYRKALDYRIRNYERIVDIRAALDRGLPVIVGLQLREAFEDCEWDGYAASPATFKHVMLVVGYRAGEYLLANSWGRSWGEAGLCWMPTKLFEADCYAKWVVIL